MPAAKKRDASTRVCACCLSYNCYEGREHCLKGCMCDCYGTWEGRKQMDRKIEEEREQRYEEEVDLGAEESWKRELEEVLKGERERSREMRDLDTECHRKGLCRRFIADSEGVVDIQPLYLRSGCSKFLQSIKWERA